MKRIADTLTLRIQEKCLQELCEARIENGRKILTNYLLILNLLIKFITAIFLCRLYWLNLYYTVLSLLIILMGNLSITTLYLIYYKRCDDKDKRVNFSRLATILILIFSIMKYDRDSFKSKVNRVFTLKIQLLWHYFYFLPQQ